MSPNHLAARLPFFYGWVMMPVVLLTLVATMPGQTFGISVFYPYLRASLGLSASELSGAYMLGTLLASIPMTAVGGMMDRFGARRTLTVVVILFGITCIGMSRSSGLITIFLAFLFLRMFGQGAMALLAGGTLAMWFHRRLGTVGGLNNLGLALSMGLGPALNLWLINQYGWRWTYVLLGLAVWALMLPLLALLFRNRPEEIGQERDGGPGPAAVAAEDAAPDRAFTLSQALRTRAYWIYAAIAASWSMMGTGVHFHAVPLFGSHGLPETAAATMFSFYAGGAAASRLVAGVLADRAPLNLLLCLSAGLLCSSLILLHEAPSTWLPQLTGGVMGMGTGVNIAVSEPLLVRYFGRRHLGKILGAGTTIMVGASSFGPFVLGLTFDLSGSYAPAVWSFAVLAGLITPLGLLGTPPSLRRADDVPA